MSANFSNHLKFEYMKLLTLFIASLMTVGVAFAQDECKPYLPITKGTTWEITNFNGKGKQVGRSTYELADKVTDGNKVTFTIKTTSYDKKDQEVFQNTFEAYCVDGNFEIDMAFKMNGESMQSYQNMDVDVDASSLKIPTADTSPGTMLEDGSLTVTAGGTPGINLRMTILVTDRKVEAKEDLTTPAGTFSCLVLSQKVSTKMVMNVEGRSKEWYAENIGMVRSESYNKGGKLMGYSELTKLDQK